MIENSRAGRLIGQKGSTLQSLKSSSHVTSLQLNNEPQVSERVTE
jgi:predicted RNA-binding protein Jag